MDPIKRTDSQVAATFIYILSTAGYRIQNIRKMDTVVMHASVQCKLSTSHSMFIKVATADYVSRHYEK